MAAPSLPSKGKRLLRRYPILAPVPEDERPAIVRSALRHPLLLFSLVAVALLVLPAYFDLAFAFLQVETEANPTLKLAKFGGAVLAPIVLLVPLLSRFVVPAFLRKEMIKRGYTPQ